MSLPFIRYTLANGLTLIVHQDKTTPLAAVNVVYKVGSKYENPQLTGMAHLFEHFMFCGSKNIPDYDEHLQKIGAVNNAYTSQDLTHYYIILPADNLETAFWLESDRMMELAFNQQQLDIQKNVVMEEFKNSYLNQPFGDLWATVNQQIYRKHPYQWLPIGKKLSHIEKITMDDMKDFFSKFYIPNNAVLCVSGCVEVDKVIRLAEKWFSDIPASKSFTPNFPKETEQKQKRVIIKEREDIPYSLLVKSWLMCERLHPDFYAYDLLSDLFGNGKSSILYRHFVIEKELFTSISCHISATFDEGYWTIIASPNHDIVPETANELINDFIYHYQWDASLPHQLQRVKNRVESVLLHNELKLEDRSSLLAVCEALSSIESFENEKDAYFQVSESELQKVSNQIFIPEKENTLIWVKK
jgi:predicted Zn-dependent peptidase